MIFKFKFTSVIFVMILAVLITLSVFTLTRPNLDMRAITVTVGAVILAAAAVIAILFARSVVKQIDGVSNTLKDITKGEDCAWQIDGNSEDNSGALEGMVTGIQSATKTLVKNNVSIKGLIDSYETGLTGLQDVMADLRDIVDSIDSVLQKSETYEMNQGHN